MPELLSEALGQVRDIPGLPFLVLTAFLAALIRGFAGFGTALIFLPVATRFLPLPQAIAAMVLVDLATVPTMIPRAWKQADRRGVAVLCVMVILFTPVGVAVLARLSEEVLRWSVSLLVMATLAVLVSGWRFRGTVGTGGLMGLGAVSGLMGGTTGLSGPPVILFYLAGPGDAARTRASTFLFLVCASVTLLVSLLLGSQIGLSSLLLGLVLVLPYGAGLWCGQSLFRPERERLFRIVAYCAIAGAAIAGLPLG